MISCRAWLVTMDESCLYHYDPEIKQQSMEWRHSWSRRPKNSECINPLEKFSPRFFEITTASSSLIIFQVPNNQRGVLLISAGATEENFEGKTPRGEKVNKGFLFLHFIAPAHRALASQKELAYLGFQCFDHLPYSPNLAPSHYYQFPGLKNQMKFRPFSSDAGVIDVEETWMDGKNSEFFWVACRS